MWMRWSVVMIWVALALMPLRGLAQAVIVAAGPVTASGATALPPCHAGADLVDATTACQMCDLCHAGAVAAKAVDAPTQSLPAAPPQTAGLCVTGQPPPDGLFRPPRP